MHNTLKTRFIALCIAGATSAGAFAAQPNAAQMAQFQALPKAQQEQLARQYGVDLNSLKAGNTAGGDKVQTQVEAPKRSTEATQTVTQKVPEQVTHKGRKLKAFGYNVLSGKATSLTPVDSLPVPLDYVMEAGDEVKVQLYGKTSQELSLTIDREGKVYFPDFGPVSVAGQTFAQMRQQIVNLVEQKVIGVDVVVSMGAMRTMQVYIVGETGQPGAYNVNGLTTITQALIASGGVLETGSLRNIQLKRKGKTVSTLDLYELLINGDTTNDARLLAGDTLFVPAKTSSISVEGEVLRPAVYELDSRTTLAELLKLSGGVLPQAYLSKVNVRRTTSKGMQQFTLDLTKAKGRNFVVKSGDEVEIARSSLNLTNAVAIRGEVIRQGALSYKKGMKVTDVIASAKDDLKQSADLDYALIVREVNANRDIEVLQFNLGNALHNPKSKDNIRLNERDQIFVFDNGLELGYWYGAQTNRKADAADSQELITKEKIDTETGALVIDDKAQELNVQDTRTVSKGENIQQTSREALLNPIIERLKAQSSFAEPAKLVEITGAVKFPGTYPLVQNGGIEQLILAAGGLHERAYLTQAELTRSMREGESYTSKHYPFALNKALNGEQVVELQAQDHIVIKTQPNWQQDMMIELQGEVVFPGIYTFERGETLQDIIQRAGGLTEFAYADGAVFSRERLKRQEQERLRILNMQLKQEIGSLSLRRQNSSATYTTPPSEAMDIADELANVEAMGRLVINLPKAIAGDEIADVMLEKGDKLYVPAKNPVISVMGEVQFASNHTYQPGMTVEQYLETAGGTKKQADTDRIYVVRADGSVMMPNNSFWFSRKDKPLAPGDTIIVPIDTDYLDGLSTLTSATQILYQIGVAWKAVKD